MNKSVLVAGTGLSGIAAAKMLLKLGKKVILYDGNIHLDKEKIKDFFKEGVSLEIQLGKLNKSDIIEVDLCVISPGISLDAPFTSIIKEQGIPIWGEVQLAYHYAKGRLAAITGTNGKTTTTALVGNIMKNYFSSTFVVGNIGIPYTQTALETTEESITTAEISSFQLETITDFRPDVSAILNITPDHLDRHGTMENYILVKESITKNQAEEDYCILNYDSQILRHFGQGIKAKVIFFSRFVSLKEGIYIDKDQILYRHNEQETEVCNINDLQILGGHNHENIMAAVGIGISMGVSIESIKESVLEFRAVEHRIEYVEEKRGVAYYNDSKGTNPDAAIKAIDAMTRPTLLIAGGYDKDSQYEEWIKSFQGKVRYMILLGQTRDKIADTARKMGYTDIIYAEDMQEAVRVCAAYANTGDAVLLSPACASWGMFENYEERGRIFKECVNNL